MEIITPEATLVPADILQLHLCSEEPTEAPSDNPRKPSSAAVASPEPDQAAAYEASVQRLSRIQIEVHTPDEEHCGPGSHHEVPRRSAMVRNQASATSSFHSARSQGRLSARSQGRFSICSSKGGGSPKKECEVDFQQRLKILLAMEEGTATLARKIYSRFDGVTERLPAVLQLLESRWGFPGRLFPLLWTNLRRSVFGHRGQYACVKIGPEEAPAHVEEQEWLEAFGRWLQAVHARCGQAKLSRKDLVRRRFHDNYSDVNDVYFQGPMLGEGCYGKVHAMFHKALGVERAVKVIQKDQLSMAKASAEEEVNVLKLLDHPHIVRIYETFEVDDTLHIVMDYAEGGDLAGIIQRAQKSNHLLAESWCRDVAQQISAALEYMHSKGVIHCDLKPANAMLLKPVDPLTSASPSPHIVLVDFGISEMFHERHIGGQMKVRGTPLYLSPEAFEGELSEKSDMWALGIILFELLTGRRPFESESAVRLLVQVATREPPMTILPHLSREVMRGLLAKDPIARFTATECRAQEWFASFNEDLAASRGSPDASVSGKSFEVIGHCNYFQRAAMFCVAAGLSMKDMGGLFEIFQAIDTDKSGFLTFEQFSDGLRQLGIQEDPATLMSILDVDQNGSISYTEFLAGTLMGKTGDALPDQMLQEAFALFDLDGDGQISVHEIRVMLSGDGPLVEVLPDGNTVDQIVKEVGNEDGIISYEDFAAYIRKAAEQVKSASDAASGEADGLPSSCEGTPANQGQAEQLLSKMMHDLDSIDSKRDWCTPMARDRRLSSLAEESPVVEVADDMPPFHSWLAEVIAEPDQGATMRSLLSFPEQRQDPSLIAENLKLITRHFWAATFVARLLAEDPPRELEALRKAVVHAVEAHDERLAHKATIRRLADVPRSAQNQMSPNNGAEAIHSDSKESKKKKRAQLSPSKESTPRSNRSNRTKPQHMMPSPDRRHLPLDRNALGHASEPALLPPLPAKVPIDRGRQEKGLRRYQSETAIPHADPMDGLGHHRHDLALPKLETPLWKGVAPDIMKVLGRGEARKKKHDIVKMHVRANGHWVP